MRYNVRGVFECDPKSLQDYQTTVNPSAYAPLGAFEYFVDICERWSVNPILVFACAMIESGSDLFRWRQTPENLGYGIRFVEGVRYFWRHFPWDKKASLEQFEHITLSNGTEVEASNVIEMMDEIWKVAEVEETEPAPEPKPVPKPVDIVPTPNPEPRPEPKPPAKEDSIWDKIWSYAKLLDSRAVWFLIGLIPGGAAARPVAEMILEILEKLDDAF